MPPKFTNPYNSDSAFHLTSIPTWSRYKTHFTYGISKELIGVSNNFHGNVGRIAPLYLHLLSIYQNRANGNKTFQLSYPALNPVLSSDHRRIWCRYTVICNVVSNYAIIIASTVAPRCLAQLDLASASDLDQKVIRQPCSIHLE